MKTVPLLCAAVLLPGLSLTRAQEAAPLDFLPPDCGVHLQLPPVWKRMDPQMVATLSQFIETRIGRGASTKFLIQGIATRGDVAGLELLRGPTLGVMMAPDFVTPEAVAEAVRTFSGSFHTLLRNRLRDFYLEPSLPTVAYDKDFGGLAFRFTARAPDGVQLVASGSLLPTRRHVVTLMSITPESKAEALHAEIKAALVAAKVEPAIAWSLSEKAKLEELAPKIFAKPLTEVFRERLSAAEKLRDQKNLAAAATEFAKTADIARDLIAKSPPDADAWRRRLCIALANEAEVLRQSSRIADAGARLKEADALVSAYRAQSPNANEWWDVHRRLAGVRFSLQRDQGKLAEAVEARPALLQILREGADRGYGSQVEKELASRIREQCYDLRTLKRHPESLQVARESLEWALKAQALYPADVGVLIEVPSSWRTVAECLESTGDLKAAADAYQQALPTLTQITGDARRNPGWSTMHFATLRGYANALSKLENTSPAEQIAAWTAALTRGEELQRLGVLSGNEINNLPGVRNGLTAARIRQANLADGGALQRVRDSWDASVKAGDAASNSQKWDTAISLYRAATLHAAQLAREDKITGPVLWTLRQCSALEKLARSLNKTAAFKDGEAPISEAMKLWRGISPTPEQHRAWWDIGRSVMQTHIDIVQRFDRPRASPIRKAFTVHARLGLEKNYDVPNTWRLLAWQARELALDCREKKQIDEALRLAADAVDAARRGYAGSQQNRDYGSTLYYCLRFHSDLENRRGDYASALVLLQEGIPAIEATMKAGGNIRPEWIVDLLEDRRTLASLAHKAPEAAQAAGIEFTKAWDAYLKEADRLAKSGKLAADKVKRLETDRQKGMP